MDSDSDNDILPNNVFIAQNINTTVCAKGPNMTSLSFRNHNPTSTMHMPRNMMQSRYASSVYDYSTVRSRRDISPMSVQSAYNFQPRNFDMSSYPRCMSSQRSVTNGRSQSPMSMASTSSVSAVDIVQTFKNAQFNSHEWKIISDAYKKYAKCKIRKKFEKRRKLRMYLKGARHRSGGESGDQGSDSSISDDDCRSTRTSISNGIMSSRSTRTDLTNIKRTMQESNMYNDCSANFKQKSFQNMFSIDYGRLNPNIYSKPQNISLQKDRFRSGFLLPSQRFTKSFAASTIPDKQNRNINQKSTKEIFCSEGKKSKNLMSKTDSENDEIFDAPVREKQLDIEPQRKRNLEKDEETQMPHRKKNKLSPIKNISDDDKIQNKNRNTDQSDNKDDFVFARPLFPIKKTANLKIKEKLIAKSPHVNNMFEKRNIQVQNHVPIVQHTMIVQEKEYNQSKELLDTTKLSNTDVSMRPSFIKRKLFTQKLDVAENKNLSSDNENSPKTVYSGIQKEKNKARKLVTNQSCLSRDVCQDDNYLDLIHKILPPDQINSNSQPNKKDIHRKSKDIDDKWDATSVTSICNNDNVSDTYTDEDIFENNDNVENISKNDNKSTTNSAVAKKKVDCKILLDRLPLKNLQHKNKIKNNHIQIAPSNVASVTKNDMKTCAKSFWDTDLESDFECQEAQTNINTNNEPQIKGNNSRTIGKQVQKSELKLNAAVTADISLLKNTTATVHKFNKTIRSHRVPKKRKCCENLDQSNYSLCQIQNKSPKSKNLSCLSDTALVNNVKINNGVKGISEDKSNNGRAIRSCRTPKQNTTKTTTNENNKTEANRSLKLRKADLSSTLDDKSSTKSKSKKQNAKNSKQSNPSNTKQTEITKPAVNSRNGDLSSFLKTDLKDVKTKKVAIKNTEPANKSRERKPRKSNVSFSITSKSPLTRSRAALLNNDKQKGKKNNAEVNNNDNKRVPDKRGGKNGVINIVHDLKSNKCKSVRKR